VLLRDTVDPPRITAVNIAEVLDVLVRHQGWSIDEVSEKVSWLVVGGLEVLAVDEAIGLRAGELHARHYHRTKRPLSLADCVALSMCLVLDQRLATADAALLTAAQEEGCTVVVLTSNAAADHT
jgi:PIN domain nuclease of toxin-antitoxin system